MENSKVILVCDIGNTHTTFAIDDKYGKCHLCQTVLTAELNSDSALAVIRQCLPEPSIINNVAGAGVASVVPDKTAFVTAAILHAGIVIKAQMPPGQDSIIPHVLDTPETTGTDRLLAARAAWELQEEKSTGTGMIVVQAGTAITVDALSTEGIFQGGMILPGPGLWLAALGRAAQLPDLSPQEIDWQENQPGRETRTALLHGAAAGLIGATAEAIARIRKACELPQAPVTVTGGWGRVLAGNLPGVTKHEPNLVLRGLASVVRERLAGA